MPAREAGNAAPAAATVLSSLSAPPRSPASATSPTPLSGSVLQERLLPEIVHQAGIVLRDGGEGEIRLVLKPEHLGSVRIRLQLGESSLEGRIVVDNSNVKELLDAHLEQLKNALRQEGYASANIDVTVSGGRDGRRGLSPDLALPAVFGRAAGDFERVTPAVLDLGFTTVNLLI
jgi:flagellar hook-length control protein FliK